VVKKHIRTAKSLAAKIGIGVVISVVSGIVLAKVNCKGNHELSTVEVRERVIGKLEEYSKGLNSKTFDAYKYFAPQVDLFYRMKETNPSEINKYVNGLFYKQFLEAQMSFDVNTIAMERMDEHEYIVQAIMYSTYYDVAKKRRFYNQRSRTEVRFNNEFRIKYFRQFNE
jgi:hypothetical protein